VRSNSGPPSLAFPGPVLIHGSGVTVKSKGFSV
jgi:hypothetical protein